MNNKKSSLQMPSFVNQTNPPSPSLCFSSGKIDKRAEEEQTTLCGCRKAPKSQCISAIGDCFTTKFIQNLSQKFSKFFYCIV